MNIAIIKEKEILTSSLSEELLRITKEFYKVNEGSLCTKRNSKVIPFTSSKTRSRVVNMNLCINEMKENKDCKDFIISLKSSATDLFAEKRLLNRDNLEYDLFMYPYSENEKLYKVVVNNNEKLSGRIIPLNAKLYRKSLIEKTKKSNLVNVLHRNTVC